MEIYNSTSETPSILDIKHGNDLIEMIFVLNIYLYLNENRIATLGERFYLAETPIQDGMEQDDIGIRSESLISGVMANIITKSKISDITEKDMIEQAVKRNLLKQHKSKMKHHEMDEEARITHKIFRLHNLGEQFSNFSNNEEQAYLDGDTINREAVYESETGPLNSGDLDQQESEELNNEGADIPED